MLVSRTVQDTKKDRNIPLDLCTYPTSCSIYLYISLQSLHCRLFTCVSTYTKMNLLYRNSVCVSVYTRPYTYMYCMWSVSIFPPTVPLWTLYFGIFKVYTYCMYCFCIWWTQCLYTSICHVSMCLVNVYRL